MDNVFKDMPVIDDEAIEADLPEVAVVVVSERAACFVMGRGPTIENDVEAGLGTDEIGPTTLAPEEKGLWIWEGAPGWQRGLTDDAGEPIYAGRGAWRRPTPEEATRIVSGDFDLFGPPRLIFDTEVPTSEALFQGLVPHVEEKKP